MKVAMMNLKTTLFILFTSLLLSCVAAPDSKSPFVFSENGQGIELLEGGERVYFYQRAPILLGDESQYLPFNVADKHVEQYDINNLENKLKQLIEIENTKSIQRTQEYIDPSEDFSKINNIFGEKLSAAGQTTDLEVRINVSPLNLRGVLFNRPQYQDLKENLMRELRFGPRIDSITSVQIFGLLQGIRDGLMHIDNLTMGGSIIISRMGNIIYFWHYKKDEHNDWLQTYYLSAYLLTFFTFLRGFYQKVNYTGGISMKISIGKLEGWQYSPLPSFLPVRNPHIFESNEFTPLTFEFNTENLLDNSYITSKVEEILSEILLDCGYENGFSIKSDLRDQYNT